MTEPTDAIVVGGGPAGLMAAQQLLNRGFRVALYDSQRSVGRKFLLAGIGGLNLTHSQPRPLFDAAYGDHVEWVSKWLDQFDASDLIAWAQSLGTSTFVGTSGRVFPHEKKAAPLLRKWLSSMRAQGLNIHTQHQLTQLQGQQLSFATPDGNVQRTARVIVLALGGGSWPQLGSDGQWQEWFADVEPLQPSNCGFEAKWSDHLIQLGGAPLKPIVLKWHDRQGVLQQRQGECVLTTYGLEGSALYPAVPDLRDQCRQFGKASIFLDLLPHGSEEKLAAQLDRRGKTSLSEWARKQLKLSGGRLALFNEYHRTSSHKTSAELAHDIKNTRIELTKPRPIAEAISSAGGLRRSALTDALKLKETSGVFACGEMLDWEAPTGGYLLTACFASGVVAGRGAAHFLERNGHATE